MDANVLRVLRASNPWLTHNDAFPNAAKHHFPDTFIPRIVPRVADWPRPGKAHLVVGARQVGKSSFLWNWFAQQSTPPLFINAEEQLIQSWCGSPALMLDDLRKLWPGDRPVLIEEAQHLGEAGLLIKGLIDGGLENPLFVTGSSSFHLRARTRESLAGRAVRVMMHPLSLEEVSQDLSELAPLLAIDELRNRAKRQVVFGGYPEAWLSTRAESVLYELIEAFIVRDASDLFRIDNIDAFRRLLKLLAGQTGNLSNVSDWAAVCGVSRTAIGNYLSILEESHVVQIVPPFIGGKRAEISKRPKLYFCDTGILNAVGGQFVPFDEHPNRGPLFENWVAAELAKHGSRLTPSESLRFWRTKSKAEIDFVVETRDGITGIEVKATEMMRPKLSRSSHSFIEAYHPKVFYVINLSLEGEHRIGETTVRWIGPEFCAQLPLT
jgi:predicted AAA+ superfamily ATPase